MNHQGVPVFGRKQTQTRDLRSRKIMSAAIDTANITSVSRLPPLNSKKVKRVESLRSKKQDCKILKDHQAKTVNNKATNERNLGSVSESIANIVITKPRKKRENTYQKAPETITTFRDCELNMLHNTTSSETKPKKNIAKKDTKKDEIKNYRGNISKTRSKNNLQKINSFSTIEVDSRREYNEIKTPKDVQKYSERANTQESCKLMSSMKSFSIILERCEVDLDEVSLEASSKPHSKQNLRYKRDGILNYDAIKSEERHRKEPVRKISSQNKYPILSQAANVKARNNTSDIKNKKPQMTEKCKGFSKVTQKHSITYHKYANHLSPTLLPATSTSSLFKNINQSEGNDVDPYSFEMSLTEVIGKKAAKKTRKAKVKPKPGNKMDLLIKQQELDAAEYSCNVLNNPDLFKDQQVEINKQIKSSYKVAANQEYSLMQLMPSLQRIENRVEQSKNWQSHHVNHQTNLTKANDLEAVHGTINSHSDLPLKIIQAITRNQSSSQAATPLRVPGNLPSAFYMGLSSNDGTPTLSSDLVAGRKGRRLITYEPNIVVSELKRNDCTGNSNNENIQPPGYKSPPKKNTTKSTCRSPLKMLPLRNSSMSMIQTVEKSDKVATTHGFDNFVELSKSKISYSPALAKKKSKLNDTFGFDDLLDEEQTVNKNTLTHTSQIFHKEDIHEKLQALTQYLPSNKNQDLQDIVQSSPVRELRMFNIQRSAQAPNICQLFTSSTPVTRNIKASDPKSNQLILTTSPMSPQDEGGLSKPESSKIELFDDSSDRNNVNYKIELIEK